MSRAYRMDEHLLVRAQRHNHQGNIFAARQTLERLLGDATAAVPLRTEAHRMLARIHLDAQRYRKARRQLLAVLALHPADAEAQFRMGQAIEADASISPKRAYRHFRKAVRLSPENEEYLIGLGHLALRLGKERIALIAFRKAVALTPLDELLQHDLLDGLNLLNADMLAEKLLRNLRFRMGASGRLQSLTHRLRFLQSRREQTRNRIREHLHTEEPVILPFLRIESDSTSGPGGILRTDAFSRGTPHTHRLPKFRTDR